MTEHRPNQIRVGDDLVNLDLSMTPNDPAQADGYDQLCALWSELRDQLDHARWRTKADPAFGEWDRKVLGLLRPDEIERYSKSLRPHLGDVPSRSSTVRAGEGAILRAK